MIEQVRLVQIYCKVKRLCASVPLGGGDAASQSGGFQREVCPES